jgi:RNA recognition motif-containing protein
MAVKLYVGGLSYSTTAETLREQFGQCGTVESATVITDRYSGQSRGFGFVEMATSEEAQSAISKLNGQRLDGRAITVELANPQGSRPGGGRGGPTSALVADPPRDGLGPEGPSRPRAPADGAGLAVSGPRGAR